MNIFFHEFRTTRKALVIWSICLIAFTVLVAWEFASYFDQPELSEVLDVIPDQFARAFGIEGIDMTKPSGFLTMTSVYFYIMIGIYATLYGNGVIAKEERDKTAEFLMSMPIRREKVIAEKLLSGAVSCLIITIVLSATLYLSMRPFEIDAAFIDLFWLLAFSYLFFMLIFMCVGAVLAATLSRHKRSSALSVGVVIATYFLSFFSKLDESVEFLQFFSPFYYFEASRLSENGTWQGIDLVVCAVAFLALLALTFYRYPRRDLRI